MTQPRMRSQFVAGDDVRGEKPWQYVFNLSHLSLVIIAVTSSVSHAVTCPEGEPLSIFGNTYSSIT
jgi:hypothetical protein